MPPKKTTGSMRLTSFSVVGVVNGKNVASTFAKTDPQAWFNRDRGEDHWDAAATAKRRRLLGQAGNEPLVKEQEQVLLNAPEGSVRPAPAPLPHVEAPAESDPVSDSTIERTRGAET